MNDNIGNASNRRTTTITISPSGGYGSSLAMTRTFIATDLDTRGVMVNNTSATLLEGGSHQYDVRLVTEPTGDVIVTATSADTDEVTVSPATRTFTPGNWNTFQTFTATAIDDKIDEIGEPSSFHTGPTVGTT